MQQHQKHSMSSAPDRWIQWSLLAFVSIWIATVLVAAPLLSWQTHTLLWLLFLFALLPPLVVGWRVVRYAFPLR